MVRYNIQGIQKGSFMGIAPTQQPMTVSGVDIFHLDNGKITQHLDAAHQINALPGFNRQAPSVDSKWIPDSLVSMPLGSEMSYTRE